MFAIFPKAGLLIQYHVWLLQITWYFTLYNYQNILAVNLQGTNNATHPGGKPWPRSHPLATLERHSNLCESLALEQREQ